jgi:anti-sigma factor RsiW
MTIHDDIDNYLAADLHNELSEQEERALHTHLIECAACRKIHQESKIMNKVLEEKFDREKPDPAFEQRMLAGFRNRIPQRTASTAKLIVGFMRLRSAQIAALAALLLALVQVGRVITGEGASTPRNRQYAAEERVAAQPSVPFSTEAGALGKSAGIAQATDKLATDNPILGGRLATPSVPAQTESTDEKKPTTGQMEAYAVDTYRSNDIAPAALANGKLVRNAQVEIEIANFDEAVQKITAFANEERGYVATTSSEKQANGKLKGEIVVKVLPENLDRFLQKIRGLGELKNQTLGTEDVTKAYFDTDARLKNARVMEQRLIDMLKTKTGKVSDLLQVEKELGRVREGIEKMQGELKYWDSQVQFATVTISLAEKDLEEPAAFLVKERAQLALYAPDVEKVYNDIKGLASQKVQITNAQLDRDYSGRVSGRVGMLIAPEESDAVMGRVKGFGRVENFQGQTERIAQGGSGMSENARTKRDKVELNVTISREEQEQAFQQTSLQIRASSVDEKAKQLHELTEKQNGRVRSSSFSRDPNGREFANISLRVPMKNYPALLQSLNSLGKVENVSVQRQDRSDGQIDEANAPADISIQIYSQGNIVSYETGLIATLRHTLAQGAAALMWSLRMIGVALAFLAPWAIAIVAIVWIAKRIVRAKR